jgi:hypothetical protein
MKLKSDIYILFLDQLEKMLELVVGLKDCMAIENNATEKNEGLVSYARPSGSATQNPRQKKLCNHNKIWS